jgi:hypothetical protein
MIHKMKRMGVVMGGGGINLDYRQVELECDGYVVFNHKSHLSYYSPVAAQ